MPKKTPTQNYIDKAVKQAAEAASKGTHMEGCNFVGVKYDAKAVEAITLIAEGLIENAQGLSKLAEVLKASNVQIDAMIKIDSPGRGKENE